jgi:hypothetical protein
VTTAAACGAEAQSVRQEVLKRGEVVREAIIARFEKAKAEGDLGADVDVEGLTSLLFAMIQGISVQAGSGATREQLDRLVKTGLALWPSR